MTHKGRREALCHTCALHFYMANYTDRYNYLCVFMIYFICTHIHVHICSRQINALII